MRSGPLIPTMAPYVARPEATALTGTVKLYACIVVQMTRLSLVANRQFKSLVPAFCALSGAGEAAAKKQAEGGLKQRRYRPWYRDVHVQVPGTSLYCRPVDELSVEKGATSTSGGSNPFYGGNAQDRSEPHWGCSRKTPNPPGTAEPQ